jgi:hypothetical protein
VRKGKRKAQGVKTKARSGVRLGAMKGVFKTVARDFDQPLSVAEISKLLGACVKR